VNGLDRARTVSVDKASFGLALWAARWPSSSSAPNTNRLRADHRLARDAARLDLLTEREHDVLRMIARGATNGEIAAALYVAEATVRTHVGSIFMKLGVRDRAAAIVFAYDHGLVIPGARPP
jgi:DNA-binding NarL/FixJ family response regulator